MKRALVSLATVLVALSSGTIMAHEAKDLPEKGFVVSPDLTNLSELAAGTVRGLQSVANTGQYGLFELEMSRHGKRVTGGDAAAFAEALRTASSDGEGYEVLAVLGNLLATPYGVMRGEDGQPLYVWPYHALVKNLDPLTDGGIVEGIRIAGYDRLLAMIAEGRWDYWQLRINQQGEITVFGTQR